MCLANILLIGILTVLGKYSLALCPAAYTDLGTGCYHFSIQESLTWDQAYFICQLEMKGYLVEIESQQEQSNIALYIQAVVDPSAENAWWIGATDILSEGTFRWMTSGSELAYNNWGSKEPNDLGGEDCGYMLNSTFVWNDINCSYALSFEGKKFGSICEIKPIE